MIFVINKLKYNTKDMELVSNKCEYAYGNNILGLACYGKNVQLWKSRKCNWLLTYENTYHEKNAVALTTEQAKDLLLKYDFAVYEKEFEELEEA